MSAKTKYPPTIPVPPRKLTALLMAAGFVVLTVTGLAMYLWPPREVAVATHFTVLGLGKPGWEAIHLGVGFLFIAVGIGHVWLNRRALVACADARKDRRGTVKRLVQTLGLMVLAGAAGALLV